MRVRQRTGVRAGDNTDSPASLPPSMSGFVSTSSPLVPKRKVGRPRLANAVPPNGAAWSDASTTEINKQTVAPPASLPTSLLPSCTAACVTTGADISKTDNPPSLEENTSISINNKTVSHRAQLNNSLKLLHASHYHNKTKVYHCGFRQ